MQKARFVIVGLQTNRENAAANPSEFDLNNLTDVKLYLQNKKYPYNSFNVNETNNIFATLYDQYSFFQSSYYCGESYPMLNRDTFVKKSSVLVIDCSNQNEEIKFGALNIRIEFVSSANIAANTKAFCLIIHERKVTYKPLSGIINNII